MSGWSTKDTNFARTLWHAIWSVSETTETEERKVKHTGDLVDATFLRCHCHTKPASTMGRETFHVLSKTTVLWITTCHTPTSYQIARG